MNDRALLTGAGLVGAIGWVQLARVINTTPPTNNMVALAMLLLFCAVGGSATLVSWLLLRRWQRHEARTALRHGGWAGLLLVVYAWLILADTLSLLVALILLGIVVTAEALFFLRDANA